MTSSATFAVFAWGIAAVWSIVVALWDFRQSRIPNFLVVIGLLITTYIAIIEHNGLDMAVGGAALFAGYFLMRMCWTSSIGGGDIKLAAVTGALAEFAGPSAWLLSAVGAFLLTAAGGILSRRSQVPHGPSMLLATAVVVVPAVLLHSAR